MKKRMVFFAIAVVLVIPVFALAGGIPDTGQTQCYDDEGKEITCPSNCSDYDGKCNRSYYQTQYKLDDRALARLYETEFAKDTLYELATSSVKGKSYKATTGDTPKAAKDVFLDAVKAVPVTVNPDPVDEKVTVDGTDEGLLLEYAYEQGTVRKFYRLEDTTYSEFVYVQNQICYDADGNKASCGDRECYDVKDKVKIDCPPTCYSDNKGTVTLPPGSTGVGSDDFYGQDGNYTINSPGYIYLNSAAKEVDSTTSVFLMGKSVISGLTFLLKVQMDGNPSALDVNDPDNMFTWYDSEQEEDAKGTHTDQKDTEYFISELNRTKMGTFDNWRLPTVQEMDSLLALDGTMDSGSGCFWTSDTYTGSKKNAWYVHLGEGRTIAYENDAVTFTDGEGATIGYKGKNQECYALAVRDEN